VLCPSPFAPSHYGIPPRSSKLVSIFSFMHFGGNSFFWLCFSGWVFFFFFYFLVCVCVFDWSVCFSFIFSLYLTGDDKFVPCSTSFIGASSYLFLRPEAGSFGNPVALGLSISASPPTTLLSAAGSFPGSSANAVVTKNNFVHLPRFFPAFSITERAAFAPSP